MRSTSNPPRASRGFTVIEIMIVTVIIAILAALAIPQATRLFRQARRTTMLNDARLIASAARQYLTEHALPSVDVSVLDDGRVGVPLGVYTHQIGKGYGAFTFSLTLDGGFSLSHPLVHGGTSGGGPLGSPVNFNSDGQPVP